MGTRVRAPMTAWRTPASPRAKLRVSLDVTYDYDFYAAARLRRPPAGGLESATSAIPTR